MFPISTETRSFLDNVERASNRKFVFRHEAELLLELAQQQSLQTLFNDVTFYAKFVSHASTILKRMGAASDETKKVSYEFTERLQKTVTLLKTLLNTAPDDIKEQFTLRFFLPSHDSMNALLSFLNELSWIKNYSLDQKRRGK